MLAVARHKRNMTGGNSLARPAATLPSTQPPSIHAPLVMLFSTSALCRTIHCSRPASCSDCVRASPASRADSWGEAREGGGGGWGQSQGLPQLVHRPGGLCLGRA